MSATFEGSGHRRSKGSGHRDYLSYDIFQDSQIQKKIQLRAAAPIFVCPRTISALSLSTKSRKSTVAKERVGASQANERTHATNRSRGTCWIMPRPKREEQCRYTSSLRLTSRRSESSSFVCSPSKSAISSGCAGRRGTTAT